MSAETETGQITANPATRDLWHIAEAGDIDELQAILESGADINASDVHGMTALMRAAHLGRLEMVRALIARGADPNATRSDQFTPLMFAAFFGHTEIVKTLVEHGATTNAATRSGASAHMWATARAFEEVARYLDKGCLPASADAPLPANGSDPPFGDRDVTLAAAATEGRVIDSGYLDQKARASDVAPVVKTLKDPPEIWDLVHEVPRHFDARSAFLSRLKSMNTSLALRSLTLLLLISACAFAVLTLKGTKAPNDTDGQAQQRNVSDPGATAGRHSLTGKGGEESLPPSGTETDNLVLDDAARSHHVKTENVTLGNNSSQAAPTPVVLSDENGKRRVSEKLRRMTQPRSRPQPSAAAESPVSTAEVHTVPTTDANAQPHFRPSAETTAKSKPSTPLSPQLIAPVKSAQPKAKVIQWP